MREICHTYSARRARDLVEDPAMPQQREYLMGKRLLEVRHDVIRIRGSQSLRPPESAAR